MPANRLFHDSYIERVLQTARFDQLIGYWPLWEQSGTFVKGYGSPLENLVNGGFETAGGGGADIWGTWAETAGDGALADETVVVFAGSHAAKVTAGATANTKVAQTFVAVPGTAYTLTFATRGDGTNGGRYLVFDVTGAANIIATTATGVTAAAYSLFTVSFTAPANCVSIRLDLMCPAANGGICYFDAVSVMAVANGKYTGVTLGLPGNGDGFSSPLFDGSTSFANVYGAGLANAFNGSEGTLMAWAKVASAGVWTDATNRYIAHLGVNGTTNTIGILRSAVNNLITFEYTTGSANKNQTWNSGGTMAWICYALTWSFSADQVKNYVNGAQVGVTKTTLGAYSGALGSTVNDVGSATTTPTLVWSGTIQHVALWNTPLTAAQISYLSRVT